MGPLRPALPPSRPSKRGGSAIENVVFSPFWSPELFTPPELAALTLSFLASEVLRLDLVCGGDRAVEDGQSFDINISHDLKLELLFFLICNA